MNEALESICLVTNIICAVAIFACFRLTFKNEKRRSKLLDAIDKEREEQEATYKIWKEIVLDNIHDRGQGTD